MKDYIWKKDGYMLRLAKECDAEEYYEQNYNPLEKEVACLTGCKEHFEKEKKSFHFSWTASKTITAIFFLSSRLKIE